jgi:flagellar biosynthetic protein FlhB
MSGGGERTEQATPQRMKKVRTDGSLGRSQDLSAWLVVAAAAVALPATLERGAAATRDQFRAAAAVAAAPSPEGAVQAMTDGLWSMLSTLTPLMAAACAAAIIGSAAQGGVHVSMTRLKPKFTQLNVLKGIQKLFSGQAWWQGAKAGLKTVVVGAVLYIAASSMVPLVMLAGQVPLDEVLAEVGSRAAALLTWAIVAGLVLAVIDVLVVIKRNRKQTRMTKQEVKEEHKTAEGDPQLKGAIRAKQLAVSRNRMMAAVATADVVLVNPTHVAVALRYQPGDGAPRVVAKGAGHVAARIRERALKHHVAVVQDITLARTLHAACALGAEVPEHLYEAVARVLAFVMLLRRRGSAAGIHRAPQPA